MRSENFVKAGRRLQKAASRDLLASCQFDAERSTSSLTAGCVVRSACCPPRQTVPQCHRPSCYFGRTAAIFPTASEQKVGLFLNFPPAARRMGRPGGVSERVATDSSPLGAAMGNIRDIEVVAPNFKKRLSGVTATVVQLVPLQGKMRLGIAALGPGLPPAVPRIRLWQVPGLLRRPANRRCRVWHARRNIEMVGGLILRHIFRAPLKLIFTSASQRHHKPFTKRLIRRMDVVIATSHKTAAYLQVPSTVIMHGVDTGRFCPAVDKAASNRALGLDPNVKIVGCFGRIRHQKGTDLFVETMIRLLPQRADWIAMIAGRTTAEHTEFEQQLRGKIAAAGLSDRIRFVGEHTAIEQKYQELSLLVAPQRWEGFGLTPLEAMACGVPVVATDVGAFSELIVEGKTGTIVERDNLDAMVAATARFMDDEPLRKAAGQAGVDHVRKNFRLEREAQSLIMVYERLMSAEGSPAA